MTYAALTEKEKALMLGHMLEGLKQSRNGSAWAWWRLYYLASPLRRRFLSLLKARLTFAEYASVPKCFNADADAIENDLAALAAQVGFELTLTSKSSEDPFRWITVEDNPYLEA